MQAPLISVLEKMITMTRLLAIDPGSNKCGLAYFEDGSLCHILTLTSKEDTPLHRRLDMAWQLEEAIKTADIVVSEEPLLLGRNNNGMQRLLGYIEFLAYESQTILHFKHPMTIKKAMESGSSDKLDIALAAGRFVKTDKEQDLIADAISREAFDETDAVCVGLTYLKELQSDSRPA